MTHGELSPEAEGATRRDFLKRSAIVGGVVWAVPAVQMVSMTAAHADSPSAPANPGNPGNPGVPENPPPTGGTPQNPPPTGESPQNPPSTGTPAVEPAVLPSTTQPTTEVMGTQVQGTLPKTGPDLPIATTLALGAGLIVAGGAAVAASHSKTAVDGLNESGRHARGPAE